MNADVNDRGAAGPDGDRVIEVALPARSYPITVGMGVLSRTADVVRLPARASRALVVTQEPVVAAGHVDPVEASLRAAGLAVARHVLADGEAAKDIAGLAGVWAVCAAVPLTRDDVIVAVGGGVVGDLAGFAAASYNRGVAVVQVPTTLLAQVDAAIGGKTGINLAEGKNLVGAFHQPAGVVCDVAALGTLPRRLLVEGLGEVVKCGLIRDPHVLTLLESAPAVEDVDAGDARGSGAGGGGAAGGGAGGGGGAAGVELTPALLRALVERSAAVKAAVVAADEREGGERAHLNLGHTYGHAVETLSGYGTVLHGEAVAIGTVVALRLGARLGRTPASVVARGEALLARVGLPVRGPSLDRTSVWQVMARDKKAAADGVRFVVLDDLARPAVITPARADVDAVLDELDAEAGA